MHQEAVVFFGGKNNNLTFNDLTVLNIDELAWQIPTVTGAAPKPRHGHGVSPLR